MDERAIEQVIGAYGDALYCLALFYVRSAADAEDVVQEVLITYLRKGEGKDRRWLMKVTANKCRDLLRKRKRERDLRIAEPPSPLGDDLYEALGRLKESERRVVWMYYFEGYSTQEIAAMLHLGEAAVRKRMERARKNLKAFLEE